MSTTWKCSGQEANLKYVVYADTKSEDPVTESTLQNDLIFKIQPSDSVEASLPN